jgi:N-methylhydantoinase A
MHDHPQLTMKRTLYFRFRKQTHELAIPVPNGKLELPHLEALVRDFFVRYERIYGQGTSLADAGIEINTFRVEGRIPSPSTITVAKRATGTTLAAAGLGSRDVLFEKEPVETQIYRGELVPAGVRVDGPAILEFFGTTVVIGPGQHGINDDGGNVVIRLN